MAIGDFLKNKNEEIKIMWYRFATKIIRPPKPGEIEIPEGMSRRFHYTSSDEILDQIAKEGLKREKSESWKYGDPKAIWSNPKMVNDRNPTVEFWEDPKHIIGDQYQFKDVLPEQIIAKHYSWYSTLHYILDMLKNEKMSIEEILQRLELLKDTHPYDKVYEEIKKYVV